MRADAVALRVRKAQRFRNARFGVCETKGVHSKGEFMNESFGLCGGIGFGYLLSFKWKYLKIRFFYLFENKVDKFVHDRSNLWKLRRRYAIR